MLSIAKTRVLADDAVDWFTNPLGSLAKAIADTAGWLLRQLIAMLLATSRVDFTNMGFIRVYALVFAASAFITVILWTVAVAKRALRGVELTRAVGEAVGYLCLSVVAGAFAPVALAELMDLVDALTSVVAADANQRGLLVLRRLSDDVAGLAPLDAASAGVMILVGLLLIAATALMWFELVLRAAALYVGGLFGSLTSSALVDRDLWRHYKRWIGAVVALALVKPILFMILDLAAALDSAGALSWSSGASAVFTGSVLLFLAVFASWTVYRWVPSFGDDIAAAATRREASSAGPAAAFDGPAVHARTAMHTRVSEAVIARTRGYGKHRNPAGDHNRRQGSATVGGNAQPPQSSDAPLSDSSGPPSPPMPAAPAGRIPSDGRRPQSPPRVEPPPRASGAERPLPSQDGDPNE